MGTDHDSVGSPVEAVGPGYRLPDLAEITFAQTRFSALLGELPPSLSEIGYDILDRISTANWSMEWCLPIWLGRDIPLDANARQTMVLSNALGLGYVRLMDDLVDGEADRGTESSVAMLANALYHHAVRCYVKLLGDEPRFWDRFEEYMSRWRLATLGREQSQPAGLRDLDESALLALAERGAPLKISGVAACFIAGREDAMPVLLSALDHWLISAVLLDHVQDWSDDLDAGRCNALVAHVAQWPPNSADEARFAVAERILFGGGTESYYDAIRKHLGMAAHMAGAAGCAVLSQQMEMLGERAVLLQERNANQARARLCAATQQLLGKMGMSVRQPVGMKGDDAGGTRRESVPTDAQGVDG